MQSLYTEQDLLVLKTQLKKRHAVLLALSAVFVAVIVLSFLLRDDKNKVSYEWLTILTAILWGFTVVFMYDFCFRPLKCYARHIDTALHGRSHETLLEFSRFDSEESLVDGVRFRDLIFLGDADKHGIRERLYYWDAELPLPDFSAGDAVTLTYYDKAITGYSKP